MKNRDIEAGAKAIANDLQLPGGRRKKLARVVADHLQWFDLAEARGMTWDDMIAVLAAAGVTRDDGRPLSRGTLSSVVWRKRQEKRDDSRQKEMGSIGERTGRAPGIGPRRSEPQPIARHPARPMRDRQAVAKSAAKESAPAKQRPSVSGPRAQDKDGAKAVLAYMQRAARIRRNADEPD